MISQREKSIDHAIFLWNQAQGQPSQQQAGAPSNAKDMTDRSMYGIFTYIWWVWDCLWDIMTLNDHNQWTNTVIYTVYIGLSWLLELRQQLRTHGVGGGVGWGGMLTFM